MKWISVKDRLPEPHLPVLVYYRGHYDEHDGILTMEVDEYSKKLGQFYYYGEFVTHWMPLPKPPTE